MGSRMPTNTTSPSRISRAAAAIISSWGEWPSRSGIAVVDRRREQVALDPEGFAVDPLQVGGPVGHAAHPLPRPAVVAVRRPRPLVVVAKLPVVAPPVALERGGMRSSRLGHDGDHLRLRPE